MKIISPKYDECIKEIFANEKVRKYFISDVLTIPVEEIRTVRLLNTHLWKRYRNQKLGILDILVELNDDSKINIEMQKKNVSFWDRRQLFYLSKLYASDLLVGEDYSKLRRSVLISIVDFELTDRKEYHSVYRLKDDGGNVFSDLLEIHTIELGKRLTGDHPLDDWIQFFNAETEEELDMIKTKNIGVQEAIQEVRVLSLSKRLRMRYEAHMKEVRDQRAREDYVKKQGLEQGLQQGLEQGLEQGIKALIETCREFGVARADTAARIADKFAVPQEDVQKYLDRYLSQK